MLVLVCIYVNDILVYKVDCALRTYRIHAVESAVGVVWKEIVSVEM